MKKKILFQISSLFLLLFFNECTKKTAEPELICPSNVFPINDALVVANSTINLAWYSATGAKQYDIYMGINSNPPIQIASNIIDTTYNYQVPAGDNNTYKWYVKPKDEQGNLINLCQDKPTIFTAKNLPDIDTQQKVVNVLVLNYVPEVGGMPINKFYNWGDPRTLADNYKDEVLTSSHNLIKYNIVEWRDLKEFPVKNDGFSYNANTYLACASGGSTNCHNPDGADYIKIISDQKIADGINQNIFEEVWIFGGPYFGFWESAMAGPNAFNINGSVYDYPGCNKAFAIMGFSYERGVAEMLHDLCHRTEATMSKVYGGWEVNQLTTSWAKFAANAKQSNGVAAVGTCHYPPNATNDYDYENSNFVWSSADDWLNYPLVSNYKKQVNKDTWGGPDYQRNYLKWWFYHLPHRVGKAPDGKLNNWWLYLFDFNKTILK